jgi:hypothetical protein
MVVGQYQRVSVSKDSIVIEFHNTEYYVMLRF